MNALRDFFRRFGVDRAIAYGVAMRCWQIPAGLGTALLIALFFTPQIQGAYYTLARLIGLQNVVDSGLQSVLLHITSHESARLRFTGKGLLRGNRRALQRITSVARFGIVWFSIGAVIFAVCGWLAGYFLFRDALLGSHWLLPLTLAIVFVALSLILSPLIGILEGCNQVERINRLRLIQAISGSLVVWCVIASGGMLWALAATTLVQLAWEIWLVLGHYGPLFKQMRNTDARHLNWKSEIWPLQWKISLQSVVRELANFPLIPVLFMYQGAETAGRAGMTLQVFMSLQLAAFAWIRTRAPRFGMLISARRYSELDRLFRETTLYSTLLLMISAIGFCLLLYGLNLSQAELAARLGSRFLPPSTAVWFAAAMVPLHLVQCFSIYLRSHKQDPVWRITIVGNVVLAVSVVVTASWIGVEAAGMATFLSISCVTLPGVVWVWSRFKTES